ncbi:helix-turn-helix transcriptional regulator [Pseudanabaena sp. FACHB-2040]|uniref:helix-turn-helix domain-containing protein n=1 Tax=Pseudanabaena sp. FACHB-2040 TaxID=2692859 RepID=UPI001683DE66|nr:helix-turn-helix transcriptional regulator [Pseudanabaena sp. FACHB-2040]MBD2256494.1 helix-turn-helix transcriptional regulator [Pseudanabaena sp. FACHB-2040]
MGKAGKVLKAVLEEYEISQGKLATVMGIGASNVYRWANEMRDPSSETLLEIIRALYKINSRAAEEFKRLYLGNLNLEE